MMLAITPQQFGVDIVLVASVLVALGTIYRYTIKPIIRFARRVESAIGNVEMQLKPNGGKTLRDAVDRIEGRVATLEEWRQADIERLAQLERITAAQEEVDRIVAGLHLPTPNPKES